MKVSTVLNILRKNKVGLFAERTNTKEAFEYMLTVLPKEYHPLGTTALMVYHNTVLEQMARELEKLELEANEES